MKGWVYLEASLQNKKIFHALNLLKQLDKKSNPVKVGLRGKLKAVKDDLFHPVCFQKTDELKEYLWKTFAQMESKKTQTADKQRKVQHLIKPKLAINQNLEFIAVLFQKIGIYSMQG